jgi:hypothetical protein
VIRTWFLAMVILSSVAHARDLDGHYAQQDPAMHAWFDLLASGKGMCCSFADGVSLEDVDWDNLGTADDINSGYRVNIKGEWIEVPKSALVTEPNKFGPAVVWPYTEYQDGVGHTAIRCFMPGAGT